MSEQKINISLDIVQDVSISLVVVSNTMLPDRARDRYISLFMLSIFKG